MLNLKPNDIFTYHGVPYIFRRYNYTKKWFWQKPKLKSLLAYRILDYDSHVKSTDPTIYNHQSEYPCEFIFDSKVGFDYLTRLK